MHSRIVLYLVAIFCAAGCAGSTGAGRNVIIVVPGVQGDGMWYDGLKRGLIEGRDDTRIETVSWGAPMPLFALNFNSRSIHEDAEQKLADRLEDLRADAPDARIDIVAHSAGCGVTLGALRRLDDSIRVDQVVLLAPSVSPAYDLTGALQAISGRINVFCSDRDTLFLSWRTSTFGTYDNIKSRAAGNTGFDLSSLSTDLRQRVVQHAYEPQWKQLGNDGGHSGCLARKFVEREIAPLLKAERSMQPQRRRGAENFSAAVSAPLRLCGCLLPYRFRASVIIRCEASVTLLPS